MESRDLDFLILGCDGIFDVMSNEECSEIVWETVHLFVSKGMTKESDYEICMGECINNVLKKSLILKSEDNVTVILIAFKNLFEAVQRQS